MSIRIRIICSLFCAIVISSARAQTTQPSPSGAFDVQDWAIFIADPNIPRANAVSMFKSTLPDDANSHRATDDDADQKNPCPVGLIRFYGQPQDVDKSLVDVLLTNSGGEFLANWPKAKKQPNRLLWDNLTITSDPAGLLQIGEKHWFNQLRKRDSLDLKKDRGTERFLLYDLEFNYQVPIKIDSSTDSGVNLSNLTTIPLHDLVVYKPQGDGYRIGSVDEIKGAQDGRKPPGPTSKPAPPPRPTTESAFEHSTATSAPATALARAATKPATTRSVSATKPAAPTTSVAATITYESVSAKSAADAVAPWKDKLTAAGLAPTDFDTITSILAKFALDPKRLTIVYRLDPSEMDRILPLEIVPQPRKITRVGLVIIRNIDPAIMQEIDQLITQLGDDDWNKREAAEKRLRELGLAAKPKLEQAVKNKDLEIVYRAERLMQAFAKPPGQ